MATLYHSLGNIDQVKKAFSTRRVHLQDATQLIVGAYRPKPGDVVLATVKALGQHTGVQLHSGRRARIHEGDRILVVYGSRYAPDHFEALIPDDLGECNLAAAGGLAARVVAAHKKMKSPTKLAVSGVLARNDGTPINLQHYALPKTLNKRLLPIIAIVGTSMNSGKTTTAASLVKGLSNAGLRVGAGKLTGTCACGDTYALYDAGATDVYDFTDAGHASTYGVSTNDLTAITETIISQFALSGCDVTVLEIADGIFQRETAALLETSYALEKFDSLLFATADSAGAIAGSQWLRQRGHNLLGFSGVLTQSTLQMREASTITGLPVFTSQQLKDATIANELVANRSLMRLAS